VEPVDEARVDALAEKWRCSRSAAIRRAIEEAARREKVTV
jgi:predicted transcriptional regulator